MDVASRETCFFLIVHLFERCRRGIGLRRRMMERDMKVPVEIIEAVERLERASDDIQLVAAFANETRVDDAASTASARLRDLLRVVVDEMVERSLTRSNAAA